MKQTTLAVLNHIVLNLGEATEAIRVETNALIVAGDHVPLIEHYDQTRRVVELIKEARKALDEIEESMSRTHVPEAMKAAGVKTITVIGVGRVTISNRFSCSIIDKVGGYGWLRENGHEGLIQETVNSSTLGAFARNLIEEEGKELPSEYFKTGTMAYTSITKVK